VFIAAALLLMVPVFTAAPLTILFAFCGYEVLIGIFWPSIGVLRSRCCPLPSPT
jgi:hypothetical protein